MSILTDVKRIIKTGFINFWRNGVVSLASVLVFTVTLFVIGSLVLGSATLQAALDQVRDKIDITVTFVLDTPEDDILNMKTTIEGLPEVKEVIYSSPEVVITDFREDHKNDSTSLQSLEELDGFNPFGAELNIKAHDPAQYASIVNYLKNESLISVSGGFTNIDSIDYDDNKELINRFVDRTKSVERLGIYISLILALITILVIFNTIRLAIYTSREEIGVMRLVGANNNYIRGPFIVEGIMYGVIGALFTLAIFYPITNGLSSSSTNFFGDFDLFKYYISNFPMIFSILVGSGIILGIISSYLAVRKYLKI